MSIQWLPFTFLRMKLSRNKERCLKCVLFDTLFIIHILVSRRTFIVLQMHLEINSVLKIARFWFIQGA